MAGSRRGPSDRPSGGAGTPRRPGNRSGAAGGRSQRSAPRSRQGVEPARTTSGPRPPRDRAKPARTVTRPSGDSPRTPPDRPAGRPSVTGRAALLALVLAVLLVSYAYPVRTWFEQRAQRAALEEESDRLGADVRRLEAELRLWDDPAYVEAQARDRLGFVMPGEQGYVIVPDDEPDDASQVGADGLPPAGDGDWYERLWASLEAADAEAADAAVDGDAGGGR